MLYPTVKLLVNIFYRVYYTFEVEGQKKVPLNKPVILSPNHTNGFIDPIVIAMMLKPKVRFYARGDVFKGPVLKWVLNDLNLSPIYRTQDGYSDVRKNEKTFAECQQLLSENKMVLMFPEGLAVQEKRLQPLKKGLARIVFNADETFDLKKSALARIGFETEDALDFRKNVFVVPIGINYTDAKKFRSKFFIKYGDPISLKKFEKVFKHDKINAISDFTKLLEQEMRKLIITINNKENDKLVEGVKEIYLHQWMVEKKYDLKSIGKEFEARKEITGMINHQDAVNPERVKMLKERVIHYLKQLNSHALRDHLLRPETINNTKATDFILEFMIIWIGLPIYGLGLLMNYPPYYFAKSITAKKIKKAEFKASVQANVAMFAWLPYYGIQLLIVALAFRNWSLLLVYSFLVPMMGYYVINFYPVMKKIFGRWRLLRLVRKERKTVEVLMNERAVIIEELDEMKKIYLAADTKK